MRIASLVSDLAADFPQDVEQLRVHPGLFVVAPVAQEVVELLQAVLVVAAVALERDGDRVVAVGVLQRDRARVAVGDHGLQRCGADDQAKRGEADAGGDARWRHSNAKPGAQCDSARVIPRKRRSNRADRGVPRRVRMVSAVLSGWVNARLASPRPPLALIG